MRYYGNRQVIESLNHSLLLPKNIYQFKGPKGLGKYTVALEFAKKLLCITGKKDCTCSSCKKYNLGVHPDLFIVRPDGNSIKKEQINFFQQENITSPLVSKRKVYIIDDADKMTTSCQNALLKILEEGNDQNIFILVAHSNLLPTIDSRSSIFLFQPLTREEVKNFLDTFDLTQFSKEVLIAAGGSAGILKGLQEREDFQEFINTISDVFNFSSMSKSEILSVFHLLKEKDENNFFETYKEYFYEILNIFENFFLDIQKAIVKVESMIIFKSKLEKLKELANQYSLGYLNTIINEIERSKEIYIDGNYTKNEFFDLVRRIF